MKFLYVFMALFFSGQFSESQALSDDQLIRSLIPYDFFKVKNSSNEDNLTSQDIIYTKLNETFGAKNGIRFIVVNYAISAPVSSEVEFADLRVIKIPKVGQASILPKISYNLSNYITESSSELSAKDLNLDGINEIVVRNTDWKTNAARDYIFKWDGNNLVDVTPIIKNPEIRFSSSALRDAVYSDYPVDGKILISSSVPKIENREITGEITEIFQMDQTLVSKGTFEYFSIYEKPDKYPFEKSINITLDSAADYILELKNISEHKEAVRAEVKINANVVVAPQEFCADKPKENKAPANETDLNEDHLRGCKFKQSVSKNLSLLKVNTITVKLFGKKKSRMSLSIKKK